MTLRVAAVVRDLLRMDPRAAVLLGEILGPPVGSPDTLARPWER
ncbi:MAG: hypothetical protein Kow0097_01100 [Candidatus Bipolaricaulota bacterium]